ncbi:Thiamine biosynthesis protein-like protein [Methanocaldococcus villosus KIN24-T80]|uniref:Thiamine biosynthesis protein-like protein n=1 Tax=Methanocaldococcus villosus KIN24-T80 TaxID=1069083 RepID=N6VZG5_9EURY|nr:ATP-dependent sacrificial sulfur transferase LarE [Methanocaldococcus villosus]ENN96502.1 Thiamine biosynthesis protein-like protein [Methanocaldococcus villosus KIN24-T80]
MIKLDKYKGKKIIVAYSGGLDSLVLAILLNKVADILCVFIKTPYISNYSLNNAIYYAEKFNLKLNIIYVDKIIKNDENRCYYCKKMFFEILNNEKEKLGYDMVADGTNYDDIFEDRKGLKAKEELNIISPFVEAKVRKKDIIEYAKKLNIDIPKDSCLLMRFPINRDIKKEDLKRIEELEEFLRKFLFGVIRVRDFKDFAVIEVDDLNSIIKNREKIINKFKKYYKKVYLDLEGYSHKAPSK